MSALLEVDSVGRRFGTREVLTAASFKARVGEVTCLLGRNGAGKTTLLRIGAGVLRPDHGTVRYDGTVRSPARLSRLAREGLMYVPEGAGLTTTFDVGTHLRAIAVRFDVEGERIAAVVASLRLGPLLRSRRDELSGGEASRAGLACALVRRPRCLLVDEPFRGLAPLDQELIADTLRGFVADGASVVATGHDVHALLDIATTVYWTTSGTTHQLGSADDALRHEQFRREYLGAHWR